MSIPHLAANPISTPALAQRRKILLLCARYLFLALLLALFADCVSSSASACGLDGTWQFGFDAGKYTKGSPYGTLQFTKTTGAKTCEGVLVYNRAFSPSAPNKFAREACKITSGVPDPTTYDTHIICEVLSSNDPDWIADSFKVHLEDGVLTGMLINNTGGITFVRTKTNPYLGLRLLCKGTFYACVGSTCQQAQSFEQIWDIDLSNKIVAELGGHAPRAYKALINESTISFEENGLWSSKLNINRLNGSYNFVSIAPTVQGAQPVFTHEGTCEPTSDKPKF